MGRTNVQSHTIEAIHSAIRSNTTVDNAATVLKVHANTLLRHLGKFDYHGQPLTFNLMKAISVDAAKAYWKDSYTQAMVAKKIELSKLPLRTIHAAIRNSKSLFSAANLLGVTLVSLKHYLARIIHNDKPLTFKELRVIKPEDALEIWKEIYDKDDEVKARTDEVTVKKVNYEEAVEQISYLKKPSAVRSVKKLYSLEQIHTEIICCQDMTEAVTALKVNAESLESHLQKFTWQNQPLNFKTLKKLAPEEVNNVLGDLYSRAIKLKILEIDRYTIKKIHEVILANETVEEAGSVLSVSPIMLKRHLSKFSYNNNSLNFKIFKNIPIEDALAFWGSKYDMPMSAVKFKVSNFTIKKIHNTIMTSEKIMDAATLLGVDMAVLKRHLGKFKYYHKTLTFRFMKEDLSVEAALAYWGDAYDQPMETLRFKLDRYTIEEVHQKICESNSLTHAAGLLGVSIYTLTRHLGKYIYNDEALTYASMKSISLDEARDFWGDAYEQPMCVAKTTIKQYTIKKIHDEIIASSSVNDAANRLTVEFRTLTRHLSKFLYLDETLSYERMKTLTSIEASEFWGESYTKAMIGASKKLSEFTIKEIHDKIIASRDITVAANSLGASSPSFARHLAKFTYSGQVLTYEIMQTLTSDIALSYWGKNYTSPMQAISIDINTLTIQAIHDAIRKSRSLLEAANQLSVGYITLDTHLKKFMYRNEPLTYGRMKTITPAEANTHWKKDYLLPMIAKTIDINQYTLARVHKDIFESANVTAAAAQLGVGPATLISHLKMIIHEEQPLTYETLKKLKPAEVEDIWEDSYHKTLEDIVREQPILKKLNSLLELTGTLRRPISPVRRKRQTRWPTNAELEKLNTSITDFRQKRKSPEDFSDSLSSKRQKITPNAVLAIAITPAYSPDQHHPAHDKSLTEVLSPTVLLERRISTTSLSDISPELQMLRSMSTDENTTTTQTSVTYPPADEMVEAIPVAAVLEGEHPTLENTLAKLTLRELHKKIINTHDLKALARYFRIRPRDVTEYLAKIVYNDKVVTFNILKSLSIEDAEIFWQDRYDKNIPVTQSKLYSYTLEKIHTAVRSSETIEAAAILLKVTIISLTKYLKKIKYNDQAMTFELFKGVSEADAKAFWQNEYIKPLNLKNSKLSKYTLQQIHSEILESKDPFDAAIRLNVSPVTLKRNLSRLNYGDEGLTYENLQSITAEEASAIWKNEYTQPLSIKNNKLSNFTIQKVHEAIINSRSMTDAAIKLGVETQTLNSHLGKFLYKGRPLSFEEMKKISYEDAWSFWGESYVLPMQAQKISINLYTVETIFEAIWETASVAHAAARLGLHSETLSSHLAKFDNKDTPFTYKDIKSTLRDDAKVMWGIYYKQPMDVKKIKLCLLSMNKIHQTISDSQDEVNAAASLGVDEDVLHVYLSKFLYYDKYLNYDSLKKISAADAVVHWGWIYNEYSYRIFTNVGITSLSAVELPSLASAMDLASPKNTSPFERIALNEMQSPFQDKAEFIEQSLTEHMGDLNQSLLSPQRSGLTEQSYLSIQRNSWMNTPPRHFDFRLTPERQTSDEKLLVSESQLNLTALAGTTDISPLNMLQRNADAKSPDTLFGHAYAIDSPRYDTSLFLLRSNSENNDVNKNNNIP